MNTDPAAEPAAAPFVYARQRSLLLLLEALGGCVGRRDFQKLLFLFCQERVPKPPYEFIPYKNGAFSPTSYTDLRKLAELGLLDDGDDVQLTDAGRRFLRGASGDIELSGFVKRHPLRGEALVADTYRRFPYFATNSEMSDRLLRDDPPSLARVAEARVAVTPSKLNTIGYEGSSIERYLNLLIQAGVTVLCDVRRNPLSRKYGFAKSTLSKWCEQVGIRYEHLPALGIASEQRRELNTQADYDALFADYEAHWLPLQGAALDHVARWIGAGSHVALTCFERLPEQCHRHCVGEALEARMQLRARHL